MNWWESKRKTGRFNFEVIKHYVFRIKRNEKMKQRVSIKEWPSDDRPREKLLKNGEHTLSNSELLAILLRTGTKGHSAIDLARKIMSKFKTFRNMSHTDIRDWDEFKGVGAAKLAQLKAAIEVARRFNSQEETNKKPLVNYTEEVVKMFKPRMRDLKNEVFKVILCDSKNKIIDSVEITQGTPTDSFPIIREIVSKALQNFTSGIICMHNHPFGDSCPSKEDEVFTLSLKNACDLIGLKLMDHIIFGSDDCYSFDKKTASAYTKIC